MSLFPFHFFGPSFVSISFFFLLSVFLSEFWVSIVSISLFWFHSHIHMATEYAKYCTSTTASPHSHSFFHTFILDFIFFNDTFIPIHMLALLTCISVLGPAMLLHIRYPHPRCEPLCRITTRQDIIPMSHW